MVCNHVQVFKALKYMHSAELLHRDIKVSEAGTEFLPWIHGQNATFSVISMSTYQQRPA